MADYIVKDTELTSVANAIRTVGGTNSLLSFPNGFVSAVNNISGGGGSSDFSTATVTIINGDDAYITGAFVGEDEYYQIEGELSLPYTPQPSGANTIVLYKGQALLNCDSNVASISGDIEVASAQYNVYLVTGDCTITIS